MYLKWKRPFSFERSFRLLKKLCINKIQAGRADGRSLRSLGGFATANLACNTVSKIVGLERRSLCSLGGFATANLAYVSKIHFCRSIYTQIYKQRKAYSDGEVEIVNSIHKLKRLSLL